MSAPITPPKLKLWEYKIGFVEEAGLPYGADSPMRRAVERAYIELTGRPPLFTFSGWGGTLTDAEQAALTGSEAKG